MNEYRSEAGIQKQEEKPVQLNARLLASDNRQLALLASDRPIRKRKFLQV